MQTAALLSLMDGINSILHLLISPNQFSSVLICVPRLLQFLLSQLLLLNSDSFWCRLILLLTNLHAGVVGSLEHRFSKETG